MAAGDFSASYLPDVLVRQEEVWADGRNTREVRHPEAALQGVLSRQMVNYDPILRGSECVGFKATWLKSANTTVVDNSDELSDLANCDITGAEIESVSTTYAPNIFLRHTFMVTDDECKDLFDAQTKIAYAMLNAKTQLKKTLSSKLIAFLNANASASKYTIALGGIHHTLTGTVQEIDPSLWTPDLLAEFDLHAQWHELDNPYILTGSNFYKDFWLTPFRSENSKTTHDVYPGGPFDFIFDARNVDTVNATKRSYLIDAGSLGFFVKNYNAATAPEEIKSDLWRYQERDMSVTVMNGGQAIPLTYDVYMSRGCYIKGGKARVPGWTFEVQLNGGMHVAPADLDGDNGILAFDNKTQV